jgi:hypothetical protein
MEDKVIISAIYQTMVSPVVVLTWGVDEGALLLPPLFDISILCILSGKVSIPIRASRSQI